MLIQQLQKVSSISVIPPDGIMPTPKEGEAVIQSFSSKSTMRKMKAEQALAVALKAAAEPTKLGEVDFSKPAHVDTNIKVTTGPWVKFDQIQNNYGWVMTRPGESYIQAELDIKKDSSKTYTLDLYHFSSLVSGRPNIRITIEVNGQVVTTAHTPNKGYYISEKFDITKFVQDGNNTIQLKLDTRSWGFYGINHLTVIET